MCCYLWGRKESVMTEQLNRIEISYIMHTCGIYKNAVDETISREEIRN